MHDFSGRLYSAFFNTAQMLSDRDSASRGLCLIVVRYNQGSLAFWAAVILIVDGIDPTTLTKQPVAQYVEIFYIIISQH